ncbi:hypothetical protein L0B53_04240 [Vibrio sp. SS-MA-C1-2]|uniref:glycosyltransferase n=1 Tax=Vibrio sp. SS-MA-C1-2 TaxID=2908646 RepID=UPI001F1D900E|nr:glycosyltransferase [Vibrio sp. SS-MA-C1-2]UJF17133.1 hypothetical protein L0B53_04240 [Vibrio sp. SS-MA-C1-2]
MKNLRYTVERALDKIVAKSPIYKNQIMAAALSSSNYQLDRDQQDDDISTRYVDVKENKKKGPSISAIYRVKNGEKSLELSIYSIASFVDEIVIIDNNSTDSTIDIAKRLKEELKGCVEINIYSYNYNIALAGSGYEERMKQPNTKSLAEFYNYAFSLGKGDYLIKVDAHYVFTLKSVEKIQNVLQNKMPDVLYFRGFEFFGKSLSIEPFLFNRNSGWEYVNADRYEILTFKKPLKLKKECLLIPAFLHVKRIGYSSMLKVIDKPISALYK